MARINFSLHCLHVLTETTGSAVRLWGTNNPRVQNGVIYPNWDCLIDGESVGATPHFPFLENNWVFCDWKDGDPGEHTLTVQVTTQDQSFWVDSIEYVPVPEAIRENGQVVAIRHMDEAIHYGDGWKTLTDFAKYTNEGGAMVEFEFMGKFLISRGGRMYSSNLNTRHRNQSELVGLHSLRGLQGASFGNLCNRRWTSHSFRLARPVREAAQHL
jgi:hypothetical protein